MWIISSRLCPDLPSCLFHLPQRYFCEWGWQSASLRPELTRENVSRDFGVAYCVDFCISVNVSKESAASTYRVVLGYSGLH